MRVEDLPDAPLPISKVEDERSTGWFQFLREIEDLQITHSFAQDTLDDIYASVEQTPRVTEGQRRAINNIASSRSKERSGYSRRYR